MSASEWVGVVGVGVGLVAIFVTIGMARWSRESKALSFVVTTNRSVLRSRPDRDLFHLEVVHEGTVVVAPRLVVVRIVNTGTKPIEAADFEEALRLRVPGARVLSYEVTLTRPRDLSQPAEQTAGDEITLERRLLNSKDLVEIQLLVDGQPDVIMVEGRISGVSRIERVKLSLASADEVRDDRFYATILCGIIAAGGAFFLLTGDNVAERLIPGAPLVGLAAFLLWGSWRFNRWARLFLDD